MGSSIGTGLRLERALLFIHPQVHGPQHCGQHMVGFELEMVGLQFQRHMPVRQVVGRTQQVARRAVRGAGAHHQHGLGRGKNLDQRAVFQHGHVTTAQDGTPGEHETQGAAGGVHRVETTFLSHVPGQFHKRRPAQK